MMWGIGEYQHNIHYVVNSRSQRNVFSPRQDTPNRTLHYIQIDFKLKLFTQ